MVELRHLAGLHLALAAAAFRARLQYRTDFLLQVILGVVYQCTGFVFLWALLSQFADLAGWSLGHLSVLYGLRLVIHSFNVLFFGALLFGDELVRTGEFDRFMWRPVPVLPQVLTSGFLVSGFGDLAGGIAVITASVVLGGVTLTLPLVAFALIAVAGGVLVEGGVRLLLSALSFRTMSARPGLIVVDDVFNNFGSYPLTVYDAPVRFLLTFVLPVAFVAYFPAVVLLGRTDELAVPALLAFLTPLAGIAVLLLGLAVWRHELARYSSAG